jgi:hypothetical protein
MNEIPLYFHDEKIWRGYVFKAASDLRRAVLAVGLLISAICIALAAIKLWPQYYSTYIVMAIGLGGSFYFWANYDGEHKATKQVERDIVKVENDARSAID